MFLLLFLYYWYEGLPVLFPKLIQNTNILIPFICQFSNIIIWDFSQQIFVYMFDWLEYNVTNLIAFLINWQS